MANAAAAMIETGVASRRELAKLLGKLVPTTDSAWDASEALPEAVLFELRHWADTLPTQADHERPFWRLQPAQLYEQYLQGLPVVQAMLETDASVHGWGCTLKVLEGSA
eukprot:2472177-Rhodomonas_salina.1